MEKKGISREILKLIACMAMLADHIGAIFVPGLELRMIGRIAFPIYCFLLAEGVARTRDIHKYGIRLLVGALLAELPFDLLFFGELTWHHQSVMVTLLIGFLMLLWMRKQGGMILPLCAGFLTGELVCSDYGGWGVALIWLFAVTAGNPKSIVLRLGGMALLFLGMDSAGVSVLGFKIPIQILGLLSMIPISLYSGSKATRSKWIQWGFYLFYPVHMLVLLLLKRSGLY